MKPIRNMKLKTLFLSAVWVFALSGCAKENTENFGPDKGSQDVLFSINIPSKSKSATRAMDENDESRVKSIEVLLFKNGKVASNPAFTSNITTDPDSDGNISKKSFSVSLPEGTFDIMIFANSLSAFKNATIALNDDKEVTLAKLKASMPSTGWVANSSDASLIPMWGMREGQQITAGTKITNMYLHRMLSRIDVSVTGTDVKTGDFKLRDIKLYNVQKEGRIAPALTNWNKDGKVNEGTGTEQLAGKVTAPSVTGGGVYPTGISYKTAIAVGEKSCTREIYLFEAPQATVDGDLAAPYLTVLGEYEGVEGWYRIDLANYSNMKYLDVLRNHLYKIQIDQVSGTGYADEEDAKKNRATNIIVEITQWNDYDMGGTIFDGAHFVSITPQDIEYSKESEANRKIIIKTDLGTTLTAASIRLSDSDSNPDAGLATAWIKNVALGAPVTVENRKVYELTYNVETNNGAPRAAYIYVTAGSRLTNVVRVRQSNLANSILVALDAKDNAIDALEFAAAAGVELGEQKYKVKWAPKSEILYPSVAVVANPDGGVYDPLKWVYYNTESGAISDNETTIYVTPVDNHTGEVEFTIKPSPIVDGVDGVNLTTNPFYERQQQVNFRATGSGGTMRKSVILQQYVYNMVAEADGYYLANGSKYSFNVKSNRPWKAYLVDNGNGMVTSPTVSTTISIATGGYNLPNGTEVNFTTENDLANPKIILGTAKVRIDWQSGPLETDITSKTIDLSCGSRVELGANCYMVNGTTPILIPTRQVAVAMGLNDKPTEQAATDGYLGMSWITTADYANLKVDLLWTDIPKMLGADDAVVKSVSYSGGHVAAGTITVTPGTGVGSAVVILYTDENKNDIYDTGDIIKWSWHIWNAGLEAGAVYYPYDASGKPNTIWMDRNLGATTNTQATVSTLGFYYQRGRKDPIRGSGSTTTDNVYKPVYNSAGTAYTWPTWLPNTTTYTLSNTVNEPTKVSNSWAGSNGDASWDNNGKTVFDPCPEGYRVPVYVDQINTVSTHHWGNETVSIGTKWTTLGINWPDKGGYYPATSVLGDGLINVQHIVQYASSSSHILHAQKPHLIPAQSVIGDRAYSIRCVAVQY